MAQEQDTSDACGCPICKAYDNLPTSALKAYQGACHCNAVNFTVTLPPLDEYTVLQCNCSLCSAHGLIMAHAPFKCLDLPADVDGKLTSYTAPAESGSKTMTFCRLCGVALYFLPNSPNATEERVGVNVRLSWSQLQDQRLTIGRCVLYRAWSSISSSISTLMVEVSNSRSRSEWSKRK